jgi:hypothetical protein
LGGGGGGEASCLSLVAEGEDDFVRAAVGLGTNATLRAIASARLEAQSHLLYGADSKPPRSLTGRSLG